MNSSHEKSINTTNTFLHDVLRLVGGSILAQAIGILSSPIITRLFAPESFGTMALFLAISSIIGAISCFRYELSIMLPEDKKDAGNLLATSLISVAAVSIISGLMVVSMRNSFAAILNAPDLAHYLWILPLSIFFNGVFLSLNYWNTRSKKFGILSLAKIYQSGVNNFIKLSFGFIGWASAGMLICAQIFGQIFSTSFLGIQILREDGKFLKSSIGLRRILNNASKYKKFPLFSLWTALLNSMSVHLPTLFLTFFFSMEVLGYYALCRMVLTMPMKLIGSAVSQVFFQQAAEAKNSKQSLSVIVENVFNRLISLSVFPILTLLIVGEELFATFFGNQWAEAGTYAQILGMWVFVVFISSPLSNLINVIEKQHIGLIFDSILVVSRTAALLFGGMSGDIYLTLILYSGIGFLTWVAICYWFLGEAGVLRIKALFCLLRYFLFSIPLICILWLAKIYLYLQPILLVSLTFIMIIIYYTFLLIHDRDLNKSIISYMKK